MTIKNDWRISQILLVSQQFRRLTSYFLVSAIAPLLTFTSALTSALTFNLAIANNAIAERREVDIRLQVNQDEGFTVMTRKAEILARSAAQRAFDREVLVSDVSVKITAQSQDKAAIILQLIVSRRDWSSRPDPKIWATYFPMSKTLIGIKN